MSFLNHLPKLSWLLLLFCVAPLVGVVAEAAPPPDVIPDQYIVVFHDNVPTARAAAQDLARRHGLSLLHVYEHALKGFATKIPGGVLSALARDPRVQLISEDRVVVAFQQTLPTGVNRINAEYRTNTGAGVNVAVV